MPTTLPDLELLDAATGTGAGPAIAFAEGVRYVNSGNKHQYPVKFKVRARITDSATGGTATVAIQDSQDGVTYATLYSFSFTVPASAPFSVTKDFGFTTKKKWIRANVTAIAGGVAPSVTAYCTLGAWGQ